MKDNKEIRNSSSGGCGFCSLLTIAFIVLKLCGVITWSWVWVLAPMWIALALILLIILIVIIIGAIKYFLF